MSIITVEAINDHGAALGWGSWHPQGAPSSLTASFKLLPIANSAAAADRPR